MVGAIDMEEKKEEPEKKGGIPWMLLIVLALLVAIGIYMVSTMSFAIIDDAIERSRNDLERMTNVSDDYRQGYLDALYHVNYHAHEGTNVTSNFNALIKIGVDN